MKIIRFVLFFLLISVVFVGCSTQSFTIAPGGGTQAADKAQTFFISGIGQTQTLNAKEICGGSDKVIKVEVQQTFVNGFLGAITWGIYTPRQARVYCTR